VIDTVAMALCIFFKDPVVLNAEIAVRDAWRGLKREVDLIRQLQKFLPPYYGVMSLSVASQQLTIDTDDVAPLGITEDAHLLLQDLTINFSKPCVMDLKMGVQSYVSISYPRCMPSPSSYSGNSLKWSYLPLSNLVLFFAWQEPDATPEKRAREFGKYPQQTKFGFRIVGMRFYDPSHAEADEKGFRYFQKSYGRSLTTREQLLEAFRLYFSAGIEKSAVDGALRDEPPLSIESTDADASRTSPVRHNEETNTKSTRPRSNGNGPSIRTRTISNLLVQLRPLRRWFEENKSLRFYASSLLIVYEGDVTSSNSDMTTIKMIDFGRVRREAGGDQGYSTGLTTLKHLFTDLWDEEEQRIRESNSNTPSFA
jgi:Inositol polyphosphate kinase